MNDIVSVFVVFFVFKALGGLLRSLFTETNETILEETDKSRLPYLPMVLFHKVKNILCTFCTQMPMLCGKGLVYLFRKTIVGKPYCKRYLQYDDCRHTNIEFLCIVL